MHLSFTLLLNQSMMILLSVALLFLLNLMRPSVKELSFMSWVYYQSLMFSSISVTFTSFITWDPPSLSSDHCHIIIEVNNKYISVNYHKSWGFGWHLTNSTNLLTLPTWLSRMTPPMPGPMSTNPSFIQLRDLQPQRIYQTNGGETEELVKHQRKRSHCLKWFALSATRKGT